jgi:hypothetical protein
LGDSTPTALSNLIIARQKNKQERVIPSIGKNGINTAENRQKRKNEKKLLTLTNLNSEDILCKRKATIIIFTNLNNRNGKRLLRYCPALNKLIIEKSNLFDPDNISYEALY